ncbi:hypothetical protein ANCCAN_13460 [Ancylostoma caninum]|uniref:Uncharacterized protein n=1 Tax=Ancylostoma caninum TaxID=29170 RepID=A0A368GC61_ANCCA|nr:hypothetical protein ANCCAN_13460 [Ancylostoma caninum]
MEASKENVKVEMDRNEAMQNLSKKSLNRIRAKLSLDVNSFPSLLSTVSNTPGQDDEPME